MIRTASAALLLLALPAPLVAQEMSEPASPTQSSPTQSARDAEQVAQLMADVQNAVSLAQTQYAGMVGNALGPGYQGAIAYPVDAEGRWHAVIVGRNGEGPDAAWLALAEYDIAGDRILAETLHASGDYPELEGTASAMAQARNFAPRAVIAAGNSAFCVDDDAPAQSVTFATIVLPPREDGTFDAYVLNGPVEPGAIPLGRHYRVSFDQFGLQGTPELVTDTCEVVTWDAANPDISMSVYVTRYDGGDAPTPVHAFISGLLPMSMGVVTGEMIWPMAGGRIAAPVPAAEAGYTE